MTCPDRYYEDEPGPDNELLAEEQDTRHANDADAHRKGE